MLRRRSDERRIFQFHTFVCTLPDTWSTVHLRRTAGRRALDLHRRRHKNDVRAAAQDGLEAYGADGAAVLRGQA